MVRFKNRWLLVEILQPDLYIPQTFPSSSVPGNAVASSSTTPASGKGEGDGIDSALYAISGKFDPPGNPAADGMDIDSLDPLNDPIEDAQDEAENSFSLPDPTPSSLPFLAPKQPIFLSPQARQLYNSSSHSNSIGKGKQPQVQAQGEEALPGKLIPEKQIFHAIKRSVSEVFGDSGWGRIGSSFSVKYFSSTTSLLILRVARDHVRTLWGGLTFLREIEGVKGPVVCRVIGCSGTLKKLYKTAHAYTTLLTANYLSHALSSLPPVPDPASNAVEGESAGGAGASVGAGAGRIERARQGEVMAWRARRVKVLEGLKGVDPG